MDNKKLKQTEQAKKITKVAASLFAKKGYNGVGVAEIGAASGFGRGTLYHHIESKEDLLHEIASHYISDLVQSGHRIASEYPDPIQRLRALSQPLDGCNKQFSRNSCLFSRGAVFDRFATP